MSGWWTVSTAAKSRALNASSPFFINASRRAVRLVSVVVGIMAPFPNRGWLSSRKCLGVQHFLRVHINLSVYSNKCYCALFRFRARGRGNAEPAVELVQQVLDHWIQLVGDLRLALAFAGAPPGLADDDLEHASQRDPLQRGDLRRDRGGVADGRGDGGGLAAGPLPSQPAHSRADGRQVAQLAPPLLRRDVADPGDKPQHEFAGGSRRRDPG